jgi:hypothetical protein
MFCIAFGSQSRHQQAGQFGSSALRSAIFPTTAFVRRVLLSAIKPRAEIVFAFAGLSLSQKQKVFSILPARLKSDTAVRSVWVDPDKL